MVYRVFHIPTGNRVEDISAPSEEKAYEEIAEGIETNVWEAKTEYRLEKCVPGEDEVLECPVCKNIVPWDESNCDACGSAMRLDDED